MRWRTYERFETAYDRRADMLDEGLVEAARRFLNMK
jgi:hypothetical protein